LQNRSSRTIRVLLLAATAFYASIAGASQRRAEKWAAQASDGLESRVIEALRRIPDPDRRLLALHSYLRADVSLAERWSWSQQLISVYPSTPEGKAAAAEIEAVDAAFVAANPGFNLRVNRSPRSLEVQIAHWNANESVGTAAAALVTALERYFPAGSAAPNPDELRTALKQWNPDVPVALAAPGLSPHGQGRAFDFQIERDGQIIAGADRATASRQWDSSGWTEKLHAAVIKAGPHFSGPLDSPYEPWHYSYAGPHPAE
jgi:hypothetical protein